MPSRARRSKALALPFVWRPSPSAGDREVLSGEVFDETTTPHGALRAAGPPLPFVCAAVSRCRHPTRPALLSHISNAYKSSLYLKLRGRVSLSAVTARGVTKRLCTLNDPV